MRESTIRTIGATVVLFGLAVAGMTQIDIGGSPSAIALEVDNPVVGSTSEPTTDASTAPSSTLPPPFNYRLAVLSGISTDNYWAFYGGQPSVWNAYILGPTKPALFANDTANGTLNPELAAGDAVPVEAESGWEVIVPLNPDLAWSDGSQITSHDYVFTFETVRALSLGGSWAEAFPDVITRVEAPSDTSLRIEFAERPNLRVWPYGAGLAPVMPKHVWDELVKDIDAKELYALAGGIDVGGGPLAIATVSDDRIVSIANPGYGIGDWPDSVEYLVYADEAEAVDALGRGLVDSILTPKGLTEEHLAVLADNEDVSIRRSPTNGIRYLGFNLNREPMSDQAFRSALALLLDRESLAGSIPDTSTGANSFVSPFNMQWFDEAAATTNAAQYQGDTSVRLEKAIAELTTAGYEWEVAPSIDSSGEVSPGTGLAIEGIPVAPLTILTSGDAYDPARPLYAIEIGDTLGWLGFDVRPVETDFDSVVDLAFTPGEDGNLHYDMYLLGWTLGSPSLPDYYGPLFGSGSEMNNTGYHSEVFDRHLLEYESSFTLSEAKAALWEMEKLLSTDLPYLLLYTSEISEVYRSDRVAFDVGVTLGGIQGRLGGLQDVRPVG